MSVKFRVADYYKMIEHGILIEHHREEILDGDLVRMPPCSPPHAATRSKLAELFFRQPAEKYSRVHNNFPVTLDEYNEPIPDFCLLNVDKECFKGRHPRADEIEIVIEVADDTLDFHRTTIFPLYAVARIPEVWLLNLVDSTIECYSEPSNRQYNRLTTFRRGDIARSIAQPEIALAVNEVFFFN